MNDQERRSQALALLLICFIIWALSLELMLFEPEVPPVEMIETDYELPCYGCKKLWKAERRGVGL